MLQDKIAEAFGGVLEARAAIKDWKEVERDRMKLVRKLISTEKSITTDFDVEAFLKSLEADDAGLTIAEPATEADPAEPVAIPAEPVEN